MGESEVVTVVVVCAPASGTPGALAVPQVDLLGRTADLVAAAQLVVDRQPQVAVVDLDDVGFDVIDVIDAVASAGVPVLAVSGQREPSAAVLAAVRAGATGYLARPRSAADLVRAVRRTAAGEAVFSPGLADGVLAAHDGGSPPASALTERESDVLRLVAMGLTARQIANRLVLSPRTVDNHVQRILRKVGLPNRAALVRYAVEQGLA
jgi:DNA-binding NarL/FixJ family response regulator